MSTKTTFKRIALVTVAALGFGLLSSTAPASAYAASFSTIPSLTVVGTSSGAASGYGYIPVTLTADGTKGNIKLESTESITATVIAQPTTVDSTTAATDLEFTLVKRTAIDTWTGATNTPFTAANNNAGSFFVHGSSLTETQSSVTNPARDTRQGTYWFAVRAASGKAVDKGVYTVRFRLTDSNGFITQSNVSVNFVASAADSGATITLGTTGTFRTGESVTMDADRSWTATLSNGVTGGRVQLAQATLNSGPSTPSLSAATWAAATPAVVDATTEFTVSDNGTQVTGTSVNGDFYSATASDSATAWAAYANGVYGITGATGSAFGITNASVTPYLRVVYGAVATTATIAGLNASAGTAGTPVFTGAGALTASTPFTLPLTTKTASFKVTGATAGYAYQYSVAWTKVASGDQTPLDATTTLVYADSTGAITVPVTNANPIDGASAVVTITGFTTNPSAQTINWVKSKAVNISVDVNGAYVPLKNATVFTATITDNFGAPVAGVLLQPSLSSTSANYSATPLATVLTDASGKATVTITDALAVAAGKDVLTFAAVDGSSLAGSSNPATITYAAAAPAPTALTAYYSPTPSVTGTSIVSPVPTTGIYVDAISAKFPIQKARNTAIANLKADGVDQLIVRINTGVIGAKVTATVSAGAYILNSSNLQATSRSFYSGTTGYAGDWVLGSNKTGANTVTFTSGTVSTTVSFWVGNTANDARFVTLTQAGAGSPVVAQVTDRYGNGVSNASVQISTSAGTLGNGQMTTVYTTDLDGKVSVLPTGADTAVITAIATNASAEHKQAAGYANGVAVNATLAAGNDTATLTVAPVASASDVAQAATDAAAEATDAANAATDAANAAAEAADAATAAAQDAADAVAALSTQVSEMVNALKKQITALTNLVIKIQKKVKA